MGEQTDKSPQLENMNDIRPLSVILRVIELEGLPLNTDETKTRTNYQLRAFNVKTGHGKQPETTCRFFGQGDQFIRRLKVEHFDRSGRTPGSDG